MSVTMQEIDFDKEWNVPENDELQVNVEREKGVIELVEEVELDGSIIFLNQLCLFHGANNGVEMENPSHYACIAFLSSPCEEDDSSPTPSTDP